MKAPHDLLTYDATIFNSAFTFFKTRMHLLDGTDMLFRLADSKTVKQSSFLEIDSKYLFYIREEKT